MVKFELIFDGGYADEGLLEFYDAARALAGFQRSLALTTHLAINGEIITQAPSARGFEIYIPPVQQGSWKATAAVIFSGTVALTSAGADSPMGQVVTSLCDAALFNTMGFHHDYEKTLQQQFAEHFRQRGITEEKIDSLCEKIENSVADMHRPIVMSESATRGQICSNGIQTNTVGPLMSPITYEYVRQTSLDEDIVVVQGYVSSYNINTFKGRIYCLAQKRPIPFILDESARNKRVVGVLTRSQHNNGQERFADSALVELECLSYVSQNDKTKRYLVVSAKALS